MKMMYNRKQHILGETDFDAVFSPQTGSGYDNINLYRGNPYQKGYGIASTLLRFSIPLLKFIGKHGLKTAMNVGGDLMTNENRLDKQMLKRRMKEGFIGMSRDGLNRASSYLDSQEGGGLRIYKRRRKSTQTRGKKPRVIRRKRKTTKTKRKPRKKLYRKPRKRTKAKLF